MFVDVSCCVAAVAHRKFYIDVRCKQATKKSNIILRPTEAIREQTENCKATPGLGHRTRNAEEGDRW